MTVLLDSNVVVAYCILEHRDNERVTRWVASDARSIATCPVTQGALIRIGFHYSSSAASSLVALENLTTLPGHEFWPDSLPTQR